MEHLPTTLNDAILSLSQLSEHLGQLADAQASPIPPLADHASLVRFRNDEGIRTFVHQFQGHIGRIDSAQATIGRAVAVLKGHITSVHNAKAAVSRLPVEIINLIFKAGHQEPSHASHLDYPLNISHVCRSWRAIALSASWLWEWISPLWCRPQLLTWFRRMNQHPASILVIHDDFYGDDYERLDAASLFEAFHDVAHIPPKYRALSTINRHVGSESVIDLDDFPWRKVKVETIIVNDRSHMECSEPQEVRHLSLCDYATIQISHRSVQRLISLKLLGVSSNLWDFFCKILAQDNILETLILRDLPVTLRHENQLGGRLINLNNLRDFSVRCSGTSAKRGALWRIRAPKLRRLGIFTDWEFRGETYISEDDYGFIANGLFDLVRLIFFFDNLP